MLALLTVHCLLAVHILAGAVCHLLSKSYSLVYLGMNAFRNEPPQSRHWIPSGDIDRSGLLLSLMNWGTDFIPEAGSFESSYI